MTYLRSTESLSGTYRLYFATKDDSGTFTIVQVEELNVPQNGVVNELDTNIVIEQPCYLIVTGENATYRFEEGLTDYLPLVRLGSRPNTPLQVGDIMSSDGNLENCYIGVWLGMQKE